MSADEANSVYNTAWKMTVLTVIFVISFIGNMLVIVVLHRSRRNQWTTNYFVLNLAVVNLLSPTVYLSMLLDWVFRGYWVFGNFGCKFWAFLEHLNAFVSIGILCGMSFDRFYLTAYPLAFKISKVDTKKLILAIWLLAASVSSPLFYFYSSSSGKSRGCFPDYSEKWTAYVCTFAALFLLLHLVTYAMYIKLYLCILERNHNSKVPRTKIKVAKLLVAQVGVYTILWSPFIVHQIISSASEFVRDNKTADTLTLYMAYASTATSPIIYAIFSGDFRRGCKQIFLKYDASSAYRLPAQLGRKNKVDVVTRDLTSGAHSPRRFSVKRDSTTEQHGLNMGMTFEPRKTAWC